MVDSSILLNAVQIGLLTTAVIGATELIKRAFDKDYKAVVTSIVAALIGGFGACAFGGFTAVVFFSGLAVGLGASGIVKVAQATGSPAK